MFPDLCAEESGQYNLTTINSVVIYHVQQSQQCTLCTRTSRYTLVYAYELNTPIPYIVRNCLHLYILCNY